MTRLELATSPVTGECSNQIELHVLKNEQKEHTEVYPFMVTYLANRSLQSPFVVQLWLDPYLVLNLNQSSIVAFLQS